MTERLERVQNGEFAAIWNAAWSVEEVVGAVTELFGPVPRWAVMARVAALRKEGADLKRFTQRAPGTP